MREMLLIESLVSLALVAGGTFIDRSFSNASNPRDVLWRLSFFEFFTLYALSFFNKGVIRLYGLPFGVIADYLLKRVNTRKGSSLDNPGDCCTESRSADRLLASHCGHRPK